MVEAVPAMRRARLSPVKVRVFIVKIGACEVGRSGMWRRDFITLLGSTAAVAALPRAVRAQRPAMPVIGYLSSESLKADAMRTVGFRKGLSEAGFIEGQNVTVNTGGRTETMSACRSSPPISFVVR